MDFFLFLFSAEDSSQGYGWPRVTLAGKGLANKAKCLFWFSASIALSLLVSNLR